MGAPIGIITCNRINHLKECIKSLKESSLAKDTELYISVDYPPSIKYEKGYNDVVSYLKGGIGGFKEVFIFYQDINLGHELNCYWLEDKIFEKHNSFIYTEDDNVFSPNFLKYMNECIINNDCNKKCYGICGHNYPASFKYGENNVIRMYNDFDAWGYAIFKDKTLKAREFILSNKFIELRKDHKSMKKLLKMNRRLFCYYVDNLYKKVDVMKSSKGITRVFDITLAIYCIINDMYNVVPVTCKARNNGWDGSGFNCPEGTDEYKWANQPIDEQNDFEYRYNEAEDDKINNIEAMRKYHNESFLHVYKRVFELMIYNLLH